MTQHWLFISDPETWSWDDQKLEGMEGFPWQYSLNDEALDLIIPHMKPEQLGFFAHGGDDKRLMGIVKITRSAYTPDDKDEATFDIAAFLNLITPVNLETCASDPQLKTLHAALKKGETGLFRIDRPTWEAVCEYGGLPVAP